MAINLQSTFISSLNSEKTSDCQMKKQKKKKKIVKEKKKTCFISISMAGACG